jgi:hypothetical protein
MEIRTRGDAIQVIAQGARGGEYYYTVGPRGESEAFVGHPDDDHPEFRGSVAFAQRTESTDLMEIRPRAYDRE